jgi:serine/threonine-protein kinase
MRAVWHEDEAASSTPIGSYVGHYRLVSEIGRGGMAAVYAAERADGEFDQHVAIKLLRRGLDTEEVVRRFLAERQILSGLEHPHIARVIDGGATAEGRPYLVMERVTGEPITAWADHHRLSVKERLTLFLQVTSAVEFAHRRLIVHRDIKPSNVMVDEHGMAKLLDFGIAKLLDPEGSGGIDVLTRTGVRTLTPAYASPEQVRGDPVTTSSDVYQLGVLLYMLMSGRRPFEAHGADLENAITKGSPSRPSVAVPAEPHGDEPQPTAIAAARQTTPDGLRRALRGDLDAIVLNALRTEPERRYGSVGDLADDIRRYLARQPVLARPDTLTYRSRRFVTRHPAFAAGVGAFVIAAGVYVATLRSHAERLEAERDRARTEAAKATQVSDFLMDLFRINDPDWNQGETLTAADLLERGEAAAGQLVGQPAVHAMMLDVIAQMHTLLGRYDRAEPLFRQALATARNLDQEANAELGFMLDRLGDLLQRTGRYDEAEHLLGEAIDVARALGDSALEADAHTDLGHSLVARGSYLDAEAAYRRALELRRAFLGERHDRTAIALHNLALALEEQERFAEADSLYRNALEIQRAGLDPGDTQIGLTLTTLARLTTKRGRHEDAEPLLREALEITRERLGPEHPRVGLIYNELGMTSFRRRDLVGAAENFRQSLAINEARLGPGHPEVAVGLNNVAYIMMEQGELAESVPLRRRALAIASASLGDSHENTGVYAFNLGNVLDRLEQDGEAMLHYRTSIEILGRALPEEHPLTTRPKLALGALLLADGRASEALPLLRAVVAARTTAAEPPPAIGEAESVLGACLVALGSLEEGRKLLEAGLEKLEQALGPDARLAREARDRLRAAPDHRGATSGPRS